MKRNFPVSGMELNSRNYRNDFWQNKEREEEILVKIVWSDFFFSFCFEGGFEFCLYQPWIFLFNIQLCVRVLSFFLPNPFFISFVATDSSIEKCEGSLLHVQTHGHISTTASPYAHFRISYCMCCKRCDGAITMMDGFMNQVQHEETCSTCTSEKAITAKIICRCTQMSALCFLLSRFHFLNCLTSDWLIVIQTAFGKWKCYSSRAP